MSFTDSKPSDQTVGALNWSVIEVDTAIICASLSALRPLATRSLPNLFQHFSNASQCAPKLTWSQSTSKLSTAKHTRTNSEPTKITTANFFQPMKNREEYDSAWTRRVSNGAIVIERTFGVTEMKELQPPAEPISPMSPVHIPPRMSSRSYSGVFTDTSRLLKRSIEVDFIEPVSPSIDSEK